MKWITFIALLFLFSSASSRGLFRRDAAHKSEIAHRYNDLGEDIFKGLWLISLAQHLQKCPYEDHIQTVKEVAEFAKTCVADESAADCDHSIHAIFGDKVCARIKAHPDLYADLTECCEKQEPERNECFLKHKNDNPDLPPLVRPAADALCASFHENEKNLLGHYLYEVARRHPYFYAPELIYYSHEYKDVLKECCEAADKDACLTPKLDALKEKALTSAAKQRIKCTNIHKFGERAFKAWAVGHISQKFPKADFTEVTKVVTGLSKIYTECCHGDLLECADDRAELAKYICDHQGELSSKLKTCCDKPVLEKSHCIVEIEKDEPPADLHPLAETFVDDNEVCKHYHEAKDAFLGSFLHEYARRHLDYSVIMLLRAAKDYEGTLERCCATDNPHACYAKVLDEIQHLNDEPHNVVQTNCEKFEKLGEYDFTNSLLVRYTRKIPQVSTPTLVQVARKMGKVSNKCCKLADPQRVACAEDYLALVLNRLCLLHEKTPVSDRISKCCTESLVNRRPCFTALGPDDTYVPKPFSAETFTFHADLCTLPDDQKQTKKQTVLVELLKHKPKATDEQLKKVIGLFKAVVEKCCAAEDKEACFGVEGPKLVTESETALS